MSAGLGLRASERKKFGWKGLEGPGATLLWQRPLPLVHHIKGCEVGQNLSRSFGVVNKGAALRTISNWDDVELPTML